MFSMQGWSSFLSCRRLSTILTPNSSEAEFPSHLLSKKTVTLPDRKIGKLSFRRFSNYMSEFMKGFLFSGFYEKGCPDWRIFKWLTVKWALIPFWKYHIFILSGLYQDLVIPVTNFLDEDKGFMVLAGDVFDAPIRKDIVHRVVRWQLAKRQQVFHFTTAIGHIFYLWKEFGTSNYEFHAPSLAHRAIISKKINCLCLFFDRELIQRKPSVRSVEQEENHISRRVLVGLGMGHCGDHRFFNLLCYF